MSLAAGFDSVAVWALLLGGSAVLAASVVHLARARRAPPGAGAASSRIIGGMAIGAMAIAAALVVARLGTGEAPQPPLAAGSGPVHEVDYGLVELDHGGAAVAVASFKHGGAMTLLPGDEFRYRAVGREPLPPLELRLGTKTVMLELPAGTVTVGASDSHPQQAVLRALGARVSLPGGAPPRVSVKVEVYGRRGSGQ